MKYLKTLALIISLSTLTSCSQYEDYFSEDVYASMSTKGIEQDHDTVSPDSLDDSDSTDASNSTDSTTTTDPEQIPIVIVDPETEDIDYVITIP